MKRIKFILLLQLLMFSPNMIGATCPGDSAWNRSFASAEEILRVYTPGKCNDCYMVWNSAEYLLNRKGQAADMELLLQALPELSLDNPVLTSFVRKKKYERFVDHYYFLRALKGGESFDAARDGITVDMRFHHIRELNENDYRKLTDVFSSSNAELHTLYLKKLPFLFQNNGCTEGIERIRFLIENRVAASPEKEKVMQLYKEYRPLMKGQPAPLSVLKDPEGGEHTFAEFKGKWLVVGAQRDAGKGVLLVSLELDEVMNVSDRILVMYEGEIVGEFDPKKVSVEELGLYMAGSKRKEAGTNE